MSCRRFICFAVLLTSVLPLPLRGQAKRTTPLLTRLSQQAAYIFSGTVLSVERQQPKGPNDVAAVQITFRVDQAVKGVTAKRTFSIREWAGLWDRSDRYRPGEHVLLFLYHSSKLGLTSPVGGDTGRYQLDGTGQILGSPDGLEELQAPLRTGKKTPVLNARDLMSAVQRRGGK